MEKELKEKTWLYSQMWWEGGEGVGEERSYSTYPNSWYTVKLAIFFKTLF